MNRSRKLPSFEQLEHRLLLAAVNIPNDLSGQVAAQVSAPVRIDTAAGVRGAEIRVQFDPAVLSLTQQNISAGTAWSSANDTQLTANVDPTLGTVVVFVSSSSDLPSTSGSLINLAFTIRSGTTLGTRSNIDLINVRLNEGAIAVNPTPQAGSDSTDGAITVVAGDPDIPVGTARLSGSVYADTNTDFLPSALEGIPGVLVTLTNTASGTSQQTTTSSDGKFQFTNLAAGSYRVAQTQPAAYLDGGPNEFSFTLAANQDLSNQNFRELGLRPQFVYNRLLTTTVMPVGSTSWVNAITSISSASSASVAPQIAARLASTNSTGNTDSIVIASSSTGLTNQLLSEKSIMPLNRAEGEASPLAAQASSVKTSRRLRAKASDQVTDAVLASTDFEQVTSSPKIRRFDSISSRRR